MKLYIAEKPSLARAIATCFKQANKKQQGCIWLENGDCISWCIGHLLEQCPPEQYNVALKKWQVETLPIVPSKWQLQAKKNTSKQLSVLKGLLKQCKSIVHAGDPDREGQLLVDQVIHHLKANHKPIDRLLINDLNTTAIKRALNQLQPNENFKALSTSALARSRADWLYGINLTRAFTLQGKKAGFDGLLTVGRVQTPILGLIFQRQKEIADFVSQPYFDVYAKIEGAQFPFLAKWQPSSECAAYLDSENRLIHKALGDNIAKRILNQPATITQLNTQTKNQTPPLPYNLSALQIDAAKRLGMSAKQTLDVAQSLYEQHKLITYPRSDCRYLPIEQKNIAQTTIKAVINNRSEFAKFDFDSQRNHRCWNDKEVQAHHAIVPSQKTTSVSLSKQEHGLYGLICQQYLALFMDNAKITTTKVELTIAGGKFTQNDKSISLPGFLALNPKKQKAPKLPPLQKNQTLTCIEGIVEDKKTSAPEYFNDATLMAALTGIARFVKDASLKLILKETDGLGTEATRAGIIDLLFKRKYLTYQKKQIHITPLGAALINTIPAKCTDPDMTAQWELQLSQIANKKTNYQLFMAPLIEQIGELIEISKTATTVDFSGLPKKPYKKKYRRTKKAS